MKTSILTARLATVLPAAAAAASLLCGLPGAAPVTAADFYWDTDGSPAGNDATTGANLGGTGTWDSTLNSFWWNGSSLALWPNLGFDRAIFTHLYSAGLPTQNSVTLSPGIVANQLAFLRSGYTLGGGDLTLSGASAGLFASLGNYAVINTLIHGSDGLTMTGGGAIRLGNASNDYTGTTTIANGALIIANQSALGLDSSAIVVTGHHPAQGSIQMTSAGGGTLVLDGTAGNIAITRDLSLQGQGAAARQGAALVSTGNNTLSGAVTMGEPYLGTYQNTRITAADGTLDITGPLNIQGTAGTTVNSLGGVNQAGASFYNITGTLSGSGTLETSGGGTMFLNPSDSSGFSGVIRVTGSAASGQSALRIDSPNVLGTRTAGGTSSVLDLYGGILAVLMDAPSVLAGNLPANVYGRDSSTFFADHTPNSSVKDQTVTFGSFTFEDNETFTFNSRNGYGMSFTTASVASPDANVTFTNNLQGGALLSFTGNFWNTTENGAARTFAIGGNGDTRINGNILATSTTYNHNLTKTGSGTLTLTGTGSTLDGNVNVNGGTVAINDWRAINNNTGTINIGTSTTAGTLAIVGPNVALANLTTSKVINLAGTTGAAAILANQTGTSQGVILNANFTATGAGSKTLTLGGTNTAANTINGAIVNNSGTNTTSLSKIDTGTWVLAGTNTYTGATTISNGILRLKANAASSTILADASGITFGVVNGFAGGTLEFVGQPSANNVETLGAITYTGGGAATVKLTPGSGGTASLIFSNISTGGTATINFVGGDFTNNRFTLNQVNGSAGSDGIITRSVFWNGADYAYRQGGVLRAPNYGVDAGTATSASALTASSNNEITGSFATNSISALTLKFNGSQTLTINSGQTLTLTGAGVLATGGDSIITGATLATATAQLVARVNGGADSLRIESAITGTGGLTKSGAGTLVLAGANTRTGLIKIAEGTVRLAGGGTLGGAAAVTIHQDGILELNGLTPTNNIDAFNNNGIVRNTSATTDVTLTVGGANGTGTSYGIIEDGGLAKLSVVKIGTGGQSWLGLSTYTGTTTIGSTGIVSINNLQDGGMPSGIGASSSAAGNLIFNGASSTQAYGGLSYTGPTNDSTDRLFTFNGGADGGVRILSSGVNHATSSWTNTGDLAFGPNAANNPQGLVLGGTSTGDNRFFPRITDNGTAQTSVYKVDAGVWHLEATNTYSGVTEIRGGALYATAGDSLPTASNLILNGGSLARSGAFTRTIGTGAGQFQWTPHGSGGFSAAGSKLTVDFGTGNVWGSTPGFLGAGALLLNNSGVAKAEVDVLSSFEITAGTLSSFNATTTAGSATVTLSSGTTAGLTAGQAIFGNANIPNGYYIASITGPTTFTLNSGTGVLAATGVSTTAMGDGYRQVNVGDFTSVGADFATLSGVISGGGHLSKEGAGILNLRGANTYTGRTLVQQGTLVVESLGHSSSPAGTPTSVGLSGAGTPFDNANAVTLGNGGTGGGILEYVGPGETSDRKIRLNTSTGSTQIHADGVGPLILTNVANDMVDGNKLLYLRGVNAAPNMLTSQLADRGGTLGVTVDGSAVWILTGANTYTGATTSAGGGLGIGHDSAIGTGKLVLTSYGNLFAYGGDRTLANAVEQNSGSTTGVMGDHSITFSAPLAILASTSSSNTLVNTIAAGKTLTFGGATANGLTANRTYNVDGSGTTILNGDFTTSTAFGVVLTKTGDGVLQLNGTNSNFNQNSANIDIDRGTLRLGASGVIPDGVGFGNVVFSPELVNADTATLDLNGQSETVNGITATSDGNAVIDNTAGTPASLTFGANDQPVNFGGGTGTYTITDSGAGALSIYKTGGYVVEIPVGVTLSYQGTTGVTSGSFTIASPVNGTSALSVTGSGSILALNGGILAPAAINSVVVESGANLRLLDGNGNKLTNLTNLQLGSTGGSLTTLDLNVGDNLISGDEINTDLLGLQAGGALWLFGGNQVRFNLTDAGLNANQTYDLVSVASGGLTTGNLGLADWLLGNTPGGFSSMTLNVTDSLIQLQTGSLITGSLYWRGLTDNTWNANVNNWSTDKGGTTPGATIPGAGTDVIFAYDGASGALVTTLEQNFKVNSLTFEPGTTTPSSVTINPGASSINRIEVAPQAATDGIKIIAGGPASVTLSGTIKLGADQTWQAADATSTLSLGELRGEADVNKSGAGKVILTAAADPTFNPGLTSTFTIHSGNVEIQNATALGSTINSNLANVVVNSGGAFYMNNATSGNVANPITLAGGTLSAGGNTQTYSGPIGVSANSFINLADSNGPATNAARSITLSGLVSGTGSLTLDGNNTATGGNQYGGTLTLNNAGNSWTGALQFNRGTVTITNAASPSFTTNDVTFNSYGRLNLEGLNGATLTRTGTLTYAANAIGELGVNNTGAIVNSDFTVVQSGAVTLGAGGAGRNVRIYLSDAFSKLNIAGGVTLGGNSSISVGGDATTFATISGVISDGGNGYTLAVNDDAYGWATSNRTLRLTGLNTFSGNVTLDSGILEFNTVTNAGGAASSLGQGSAINVNTATLSFIGDSSQATDRPINVAGTLTLSANGTSGASITYNAPIVFALDTDGDKLVLTGTAGSHGIIAGGFTQAGDAASGKVIGGTWHFQNTTNRIGDDFYVSGAGTILNLDSGTFLVRDNTYVDTGATLNLNATGVYSSSTATLSADAYLMAHGGGTININANEAINSTDVDVVEIGTEGNGLGTFNLGNYSQTVNGFFLGNRPPAREGLVTGAGTLTINGNIDLYNGTIHANLASNGANTFDKLSTNTVTLTGNNSGLASTGATVLYAGTLALDFTANNATKLREASALDMRGGTLQVIGNNSLPTSQTVASFTLGSGGSNAIQVTGGAGQNAVLNLGAITRASSSSDGTLLLTLPAGAQSAANGVTTSTANGTHGLLGASGFALVNDGAGLWFATKSGSNIVGLASVAKNDLTTWLPTDHVTDGASGFSGAFPGCASINSLRFDAAPGSDLSIASGRILNIASGGVLVTPNVGGTPSIMGGTLLSGVQELIVHQYSTQPFEIGSNLRDSIAVTKTGPGTLLLTGYNTYTDETEIQEGTLQVGGGNAIGDNSIVTLAAYRDSTLELLADETIGRLQGGQRVDLDERGLVAVGSHTLTINQSGSNTTYAGMFSGTGEIVKRGSHQLLLNNVSSAFTGILTVDSGLLYFNNLGEIGASIIRINKGGTLLIDNNGTTRTAAGRILDTTPITLNSADGTFAGATLVRGLAIRTDQDGTLDEAVGLVTAASGASYISMEATTANDDSDLIVNNLARLNNATLNIRGTNLGGGLAQENEFRIGDSANQTAFISALTGGGGAAGTASISIVPWIIGESTTGGLTDANMGNSLVTYDPAGGIRPLAFANEYAAYTTAGANLNIREILTADATGLTGRTLNSLSLHNASTAASTIAIAGAGAGESILNTSGAFLFTLNPAAEASSAHRLNLSGFDAGVAVGGGEYLFHVVNPSSAATSPSLTVQVGSPLTSVADITKSGRGTLILSGVNTAGGGPNKTTLNEGILEIADLDNIGGSTGGLVFAGGTLRLGAGLTDDLSTRTITLLQAGGTIDTNGIDLVLNGSAGAGFGGLTKTGAGTLTLNAAATYTGSTVIAGGTLAIGANNATGNGGDLTVSGGATLALGSRSISHGLVTTTGASPLITGAGTINAATGFQFSHTGDTNVDAVLAGAGGLTKTQNNILTLGGNNTYTGPTEVQGGTLSFDRIGDVGSGPGPLGNPSTESTGIIRLGLAGTAGGLTYTGTGHSTNRLVALQGTTGGAIISANGSGALVFTGGAHSENAGAKTLTLSGTSALGIANQFGGIEDVPGGINLAKTGTNLWQLTGANTYTGNTTVSEGRLEVTGTVGGGTTAGSTTISGANGPILIIDHAGAGDAYVTSTFALGAASQSGALILRNGDVRTTTTGSSGIDLGTGGYGYFLMSGGSFTTRRVDLYANHTATSVLQMTGGTLTSQEHVLLSNLYAELTVAGGTFNHQTYAGDIDAFSVGYAAVDGAEAVASLIGSGSVIDNTGRRLVFHESTGISKASFNLNAGTLITDSIRQTIASTGTGFARFNFNGGTLQASLDGILMENNLTAASVNGPFGSFAGGAVIDSNGRNVTVAQSLVAPTGNGVTSIPVTSGGTGYIGAPYVQISGDGSGATASAVVDTDPASLTYGQLLEIVITNPGVGYTTAPTITLQGGGGSGATVGAVGIGANSSGGLTKTGNGILTLTGTNTYTGPTNVNGGALSIATGTLIGTSAINVGTDGNGALGSFNNGGAPVNLAADTNLTLGGAATWGALAFELGSSVAPYDQFVLSGTGTLIVNPGGGLISALALPGFGAGSYDLVLGPNAIQGASNLMLGSLPGGYTYSLDFTTDPTRVTLSAAQVTGPANFFWTGNASASSTWSALAGGDTNWASESDGDPDPGYTPGPETTVHFSASTVGAGPLDTTLDNAYSIAGLKILASAGGEIRIAPGMAGSLTIGSGGIEIQAGAPSATISAALTAGAAQAWTVADAGSTLAVTGGVAGTASLAKEGAGTLLLGGDHTFTGALAFNAGALDFQGAANDIFGSATTIGGDVTIVSGRSAPGNGVTYSLGTLAIGANTLAISGGGNVTGGTAGVTFGATTFTGAPTFVIGNPAGGGVTLLSFGAVNNGGETATFQGTGNVAANGLWSGAGGITLDSNFTGTFTFASNAHPFTGDLTVKSGAIATNSTSTNYGAGTIRLGDTAPNPNSVALTGAIASANIANPIVLQSGTTGVISIETTNNSSTFTYLGGITGANNLTVKANGAHNLIFANAALDFTGSLTNAGTGAGSVAITSDVSSNVTDIIQNSATSSLILGGSSAAHTGATIVNAGMMTINTPVTGTTSLAIASGANTLALNGGIANPSAITSISVGNGANLRLLDGSGNKLTSLTSLQLGSPGGALTTLDFNVGDDSLGDQLNTDLLNLLTGGTLSLFSGNQVRFNLTDAGLNANQTYDILTSAAGGLTSGALGTLDWLLGNTPGGFSSISLNVTDNLIQVQTGSLIMGTLYWRGLSNNAWNGSVNNWSSDKAGTTVGTTLPGAGIDVIFAHNGASGALVTTLEQNFKVNSLTFEAGTTTPTSVTINPGASPTNRLEIAPQVASAGINITADGPTAVTIGSTIKAGSDQTWTIASAGATLTTAAIRGEGNISKTGLGTLTVTGDSPLYSGTLTIGDGTFNLDGAGSLPLGGVVNNGTMNVNNAGTAAIRLLDGSGAVKLNTGILNVAGYGPGSGALTLAASTTLGFTGATSQSTSRPITLTGASTLHAGTPGATITYSGAINAAGNALTLTGANATAGGIISGGISQTGGAADLTINSGNWTLEGAMSTITDDIIVQGPTAVLNLNGTGILANAGSTTNTLASRGGATVNLLADNPYATGGSGASLDTLYIGDGVNTTVATFNTNTFTITTNALQLGTYDTQYQGAITGSGTVIASDWNMYNGTIFANLQGTGTFDKYGFGTLTLYGNNSGLTGATAVHGGQLVLDYTQDNASPKLNASGLLTLNGAAVTVIGNASAATTAAVNNLTLGNGPNRIEVATAGPAATLNLGNITRNASGGTVRFLPPPSGTGAINTTRANDAGGILGGWATLIDPDSGVTGFAMNDGANNIVLAASLEKDDVATWLTGENVTDSAGYFGTLSGSSNSPHSIRFNAANPSTVTLASGAVLTVSSGGILMTADAGGTATFTGGSLASGTGNELIFTNDSTAHQLVVGSGIGGAGLVTKSGAGTLVLSGTNSYTGTTALQEGTLIAQGGSAIGDNSAVVISDDHNVLLQITGNETIGSLSGGNYNALFNPTVDFGANSLTIQQTANGDYDGRLVGSGTLIKTGTHDLALRQYNPNFTGALILNGSAAGTGALSLEIYGSIGASSITINKGASLLLDNVGTTRHGTRILDTTPITLNSADGAYQQSAALMGLAHRTDQDSGTSNTETIGVLNIASGANYASLQQSGGNSSRSIIQAANFNRSTGATLDVRGRALGSTSGTGGQSQFKITDGANETAFLSTRIGGGGTAGTKNISIVPWAIGENTAAALAATNMGNSLVTYVDNAGFRALDLTTEYSTFATKATNQDNIRESLTADLANLPGQTINGLVLHNNNTAASAVNVNGTGAGQALDVTSGALLFTLNPAATASSAHTVNLGGFDAGLTTGTGEYVVHVVNPSSAATTPTLTVNLSSPLISAADLTKSGRGTLILSGANTAGALTTYGGATYINEGTVQFQVETGNTLTLDDVVTGYGNLGKSGAGSLTLSTPKTYQGATLIDDGMLTAGVAGALPSTTAVRLGSGTTGGVLDLNGYDQTIGSLTVQSTTSAVANTILIDSGTTLTINGGVTIGANADASATAFTATGGGAVVVNSENANFQIGGATGGTNDNRVTADLSGLSSFTANLGTGIFRLGDANSGLENNASTLKLAENNTITAASIRIGDGSGGAYTHTLTLGSGSNTFNADTINVGSANGTVRSGGEVLFASTDTTGTLTVRASDGLGRATLNMVNTSGSTGGNMVSTIDLAGHTADLLLGTVTMAARSVSYGDATATLNFDQGTLDIETLNMASRTGAGSGAAAATLNLGDSAAPGTPTVTIGALNMGVHTSTGTPVETVSADVNVSGGNVTLGPVNMANAAAGRTVTSTIDLTGGMVTLGGDITRTGGAGTENATVTLDGAVLDMNGYAIGSSAAPVTLTAQSGTLQNLAELNGGGSLVKAGPGTLLLDGTNSYSGNTVINGGTLLVDGTTGSSAFTLAGDGAGDPETLGGSGTIGGTVTATGGGTLLTAGTAAATGDPGSIGTLTVQGNVSATGTGNLWLVNLARVMGGDAAGGTNSDLLALESGASFTSLGSFNLQIDDTGIDQSGDRYRFASFTPFTGWDGSFFNGGTLLNGGSIFGLSGQEFTIDYDAGNGSFFLISAIPEPEALLPVLLILASGLFLRRRRRRR